MYINKKASKKMSCNNNKNTTFYLFFINFYLGLLFLKYYFLINFSNILLKYLKVTFQIYKHYTKDFVQNPGFFFPAYICILDTKVQVFIRSILSHHSVMVHRIDTILDIKHRLPHMYCLFPIYPLHYVLQLCS